MQEVLAAGAGSLLGTNGEDYWRAEVAFGASYECSTDAVTVLWSVCGQPMVSGFVTTHVNVPSAQSLSLSSSQSRLTEPDDDATLVGISTSATLTLLASMDDGTTRDMSTDSRTTYIISAANTGCAQIVNANTLSIQRGASCLSVTVTAEVYGLSARVTVSLVFLDRLELDFAGYPAGGSGITQLGLVECLSRDRKSVV